MRRRRRRRRKRRRRKAYNDMGCPMDGKGALIGEHGIIPVG